MVKGEGVVCMKPFEIGSRVRAGFGSGRSSLVKEDGGKFYVVHPCDLLGILLMTCICRG